MAQRDLDYELTALSSLFFFFFRNFQFSWNKKGILAGFKIFLRSLISSFICIFINCESKWVVMSVNLLFMG